jgi:hypothetical protein
MRQHQTPLRLDAQMILDQASQLGRRKRYSWIIRWRNGTAILTEGVLERVPSGSAVLVVSWPTKTRQLNVGLLVISCPQWNTTPRIIGLSGRWTVSGVTRWKFFCPATQKLERVVFFDPESQIFVSRRAYGKNNRRLFPVVKFERIFGLVAKLENRLGNEGQKPTDAAHKTLNDALEHARNLLSLATTGIFDAPYLASGLLDINAMVKKSQPRQTTKGRSTYVRDRTGVLRSKIRN